MSVFKHKGGNIYYAGFGVGGQYFVRSLGTSNRREAERREKKLRALAEVGRLPLKVSADERAEAISKSLAIPVVSRNHRAKVKATARKRKANPEEHKAWIASIKTGQSDPTAKLKMDEARLRAKSDPKYLKLKSRDQKKVWKRRGHKTRVSRSMTNKWATEEFRNKNLDGRDLAAVERLKQRGFSIEQSRDGAKRARGERGRARETESRILLAAAAARLGIRGPEAAARVFPGKTRKSVEASYYDLVRRYRTEIAAREADLSEVRAREIWTEAAQQSPRHSA